MPRDLAKPMESYHYRQLREDEHIWENCGIKADKVATKLDISQ
jgi:hypothetical protein